MTGLTGDPPRNLSADPKHPWHDARWICQVDVFVDGERREWVRTASMDEGWALCIAQPLEKLPSGEPRTVIFRGSVEIRRRELRS